MEKHIIRLQGRGSFSVLSAILALFLLIFIIPAFVLTSCTDKLPQTEGAKEKDPVKMNIRIKSPENKALRSLDIFFFNDDELKKLDSYQRFQHPVKEILDVASRKGAKILVVLANSSSDRFTWAGINSYESIKEAIKELKEENPDIPAMSGECRLSEKDKGSVSLKISPLMAEIHINSICCDFSAMPGNKITMKDVKAYLTNVNASSPLLFDNSCSIGSIINYGKAVPSQYENFLCPEIIWRHVANEIGEEVISPDIRFYCYPNESYETDIGRPGTRLVIEGMINGEKYYYPIEINRPGFGFKDGIPGVRRNRRYSFNIMITRLGAKDPDTPVESGTIGLELQIKEWRNVDDEIIAF